MDDRGVRRTGGGREQGFALILALLTLMLLTFLGLTLAATTSTELQIATNYRWGQQALYNAEAGLELGKRFLKDVPWQIVLPPPRPAAFMNAPPSWTLARSGPSGEPTRNFENVECDTYWVTGYGVVLDIQTFAYPFLNVSQFMGQTLDGGFTLWVRRPLKIRDDGLVEDNASNTLLTLTSEGIAPTNIASAFTTPNRAVRFLEVTLQRVVPAECGEDPSQVGQSSTGSGYTGCASTPPTVDPDTGGAGKLAVGGAGAGVQPGITP